MCACTCAGCIVQGRSGIAERRRWLALESLAVLATSIPCVLKESLVLKSLALSTALPLKGLGPALKSLSLAL